MSNVLSSEALAALSFCATFFDGFFNPLPADELVDASFDMLVHRVAGEH